MAYLLKSKHAKEYLISTPYFFTKKNNKTMDEVIFRGKTFKGKCLYGNLICKKLQNEDFNKYYISIK